MKEKHIFIIALSALLLCSCVKKEAVNKRDSTAEITDINEETSESTAEITDSETTASEGSLTDEQLFQELVVIEAVEQHFNYEGTDSIEYSDFMYDDFDNDGINESIATVTNTPEGDTQYWYVSGEEAELLYSWWEPSEVEIVKSADNTFIKLEKMYATESISVYYLLENSTPVYIETYGIQGLYPDNTGSDGDFTGFHSTYDLCYDGTGHTWKTYWFYYKDKAFHEYVGEEITQEELLKYDGVQPVLDEIAEKGGNVTNILKRSNGIININYDITTDDWTCHYFRNVCYNDNSVTDITPTFEDGTFYNEGFYLPSSLDVLNDYE